MGAGLSSPVTIKTMEAKLLLIPWMMAVIYSSIPLFWFAIHPFAARWRRMHNSPYRALLPLWFLLIAALGWVTWPWHSQRLFSNVWMWGAALPLFAIGMRIYRRIFSEFGGHRLSGEAELRPNEHQQQLVTTGLHATMRHPIYAAHLCNLAASTLASGLTVNFMLLGLNAFITFPMMMALEERELLKRFGQSYREYQRRVPPISFLGLQGKPVTRVRITEEHA
jgi:protein-S-isoprenylcysteine O-methyltransferase Ste14